MLLQCAVFDGALRRNLRVVVCCARCRWPSRATWSEGTFATVVGFAAVGPLSEISPIEMGIAVGIVTAAM